MGLHIATITGPRCFNLGVLDKQSGIAVVALNPDSWITRAAGIQTAAAFACDGQGGFASRTGQHIDPLADLCDCIGALQCDGQLRSAVLIVHANGSASDKSAGIRRHALFNCGVVQGQGIIRYVIMDIVVHRYVSACVCGDISITVRCPVAGRRDFYTADINHLVIRRSRQRRGGQKP